MTSHDLVALLHLVGFITGIALYAMLAVMTLRHDRREIDVAGDRGTRIPLAAAALGLLWNTGALVIYGLRDFGIGNPAPIVVALAFTALGFLPAVVVHSAVRPRALGRTGNTLVAISYALSTVAGALHLLAAAEGEAPSRAGLLTLTIGYGATLVVLLAVTVAQRGREDWRDWRRSLFVIALAAFAVSALHLSHDAPNVAATPDSWFAALVGHHASLPLVLVILYQDYRFAFADLFLRRALLLVSLVSLALGLHVFLAAPFVPLLSDGGRAGLIGTGVHIALWVTTALCYPVLRRSVGYFVDRVVLQRSDYRQLRTRIANGIESALTPNEVLERACAALGPALSARRVTWRQDDLAAPAAEPIVVSTRGATVVRVPTADAPCLAIEIGELDGGRRLLSDDIALLESVATAVARRIDVVRVTDERYARDRREREILQLATEAELRALRAQLNPHFLFNALTTIGYLIQASPRRALSTLYRLTDLLRAVLRRSTSEWVTLQDEIDIIDAYLAIERARFEERLEVTIDVPSELRGMRVPPLLLQPLVENAIKHGVSPLRRGGTVAIGARAESDDAGRPAARLHLWVSDTGVGIDAANGAWRRAGGVGLVNIEQRLAQHFGTSASLSVAGAPGAGTTVDLRLPAVA